MTDQSAAPGRERYTYSMPSFRTAALLEHNLICCRGHFITRTLPPLEAALCLRPPGITRRYPPDIDETKHPVVEEMRPIHADDQVSTGLDEAIRNQLAVGRRPGRDCSSIEELLAASRC
jgi:hypothetical protein